VKKQLLSILVKYGIGLGLLAWVIWRYWGPKYEFRPEHATVLLASPTATFPGTLPWSALYLSTQEEWSAPANPGLSGALQKPIRWLPLLLTGVIGLISVLITFYRWYLLVHAQELPFTPGSAMRLGLIGFYFNTFLPGAIGGDVIKATFIAREQSRRTVAVATVVIDRILGLCGLIWVVTFVGAFCWGLGMLSGPAISARGRLAMETILAGAGVLTAGSVVFWLLLGILSGPHVERWAVRLAGIPRIGHSLGELWRAVWMYRQKSRHVALGLVLAMVGHLGFVLSYYFAAQILNGPEQVPNLATQFLIAPLGMTIQAGFPAPGGVGGGEYAFGALYYFFGFSFGTGVLCSISQRAVVQWLLSLLGYLVYLRMKPSLVRQLAPEA